MIMHQMNAEFSIVGIVGAGAMGRGIAQIAAQAGSLVKLYDTQSGTVAAALHSLQQQWQRLADKGKLGTDTVPQLMARVVVAQNLDELADCHMIVEAIVERLDVKQSLLKQLETLVTPGCILATNTSSLSVTAIASALNRPERFAGFHFFNPVPLMKVAEVIGGLKTHIETTQALTRYATQLGHTPVQAQDTPGFIVNHAGRGYVTEALRIVGESVTDFVTVDRILRDQVGFKLGPFELLDLTALDVSHPVIESIYRQYYDEPRYRPSVITAQRLAGGMLGKKSGRRLLQIRGRAGPAARRSCSSDRGYSSTNLGVASRCAACRAVPTAEEAGRPH